MAQHISVKNFNSTNEMGISEPYVSNFPRQIIVSEKEEINQEATVKESRPEEYVEEESDQFVSDFSDEDQ